MNAKDIKVDDILRDWSITTHIGPDYLVVTGFSELYNTNVNTSRFRTFDRTTMSGVTHYGRRRKLVNFIPNGNAKTLEEAIEVILSQCDK